MDLNKKFLEFLDDFEAAAIANAVKGGGHPGDFPSIEKHYKKTRENVVNFVGVLLFDSNKENLK